ncbi:MAG: hypothetical protein LBI87_09640 [Candidatus Accumulibacter sp.]|jgi:hypothetical protein|nr:hypothetical protein [Accumulibacter sp.]
MSECAVTVRDRDGDIVLTREDFLKYATNENVIASALMIRLCRFAFARLSPDAPARRRELYWQVGFPGSGILDCVEMISHAVREGRCLQNPTLFHPDAPPAVAGRILFEIGYRGKTLAVWPDESIFDDEFRAWVSAWQAADEESEGYRAYLAYKAEKVRQIMALPDEALFHSAWK